MKKGWYVTGSFPDDPIKSIKIHLEWLETRVGSDHPPPMSFFQDEIPEFHRNFVTAWWSGKRFTKIRYRDNNGTLFVKRVRKLPKVQEIPCQ